MHVMTRDGCILVFLVEVSRSNLVLKSYWENNLQRSFLERRKEPWRGQRRQLWQRFFQRDKVCTARCTKKHYINLASEIWLRYYNNKLYNKIKINLNWYQCLRFLFEKLLHQIFLANQLQKIREMLGVETQQRLTRSQLFEHAKRSEQITGERAILVRQTGHHKFTARPNMEIVTAHRKLWNDWEILIIHGGVFEKAWLESMRRYIYIYFFFILTSLSSLRDTESST